MDNKRVPRDEVVFERVSRPGDEQVWSPANPDPDKRKYPEKNGARIRHIPSGAHAESISKPNFEENCLIAETVLPKTMDYQNWKDRQIKEEQQKHRDFNLINTLSENKIFYSRDRAHRISGEKARDFLYLTMISLFVAYQEEETRSWAQTYARRTISYYNFDYYRTSSTDLYMLLYIMNKVHGMDTDLSWTIRVLRAIATGTADTALLRQYILRLENRLRGLSSTLKTLRRMTFHWENKTAHTKIDVLNKIKMNLRTISPWAEALPKLRKLKFSLAKRVSEADVEVEDDTQRQYGEVNTGDKGQYGI